jgi:predicted TIM-barrel fold metal-dependent hydrolase
MKIIANHAHLMPAPIRGSWWPPGDVALLLKHLDACGIDRTVVFPPFACQMGNDMKEANRWALREIKSHADRFIPAGTVFPLAPDILDVLQLLHDEGVRWLKIHPSVDLHDIAEPKAQKFYARAEELGMLLDYHTGPHGTRLALAKPEKFDDLACSHPKLNLLFEHLGGRVYVEEFTAILGNHREHTYGGLTSIFDSGVNYLWLLTAQRIEDIVKGIGAKQFIFGLDFPWNSIEATRRHLQIIDSLSISATDKKLILGGNLARLLGR